MEFVMTLQSQCTVTMYSRRTNLGRMINHLRSAIIIKKKTSNFLLTKFVLTLGHQKVTKRITILLICISKM